MKAGYDFHGLMHAIGEDRIKNAETLQVRLYGSLGATGKGHGTDRAVLAGLLGKTPETCPSDFLDTVSLSPKTAIPIPIRDKIIPFKSGDLIFDTSAHDFPFSNTMIIRLSGKGGTLLEREYYSVGGGFLQWKGWQETERGTPRYPYENVFELKKQMKKHHIKLPDLMMANEQAITGATADEISRRLDHILAAMEDAVVRGIHTEGYLPGPIGLHRKAPLLYQRVKKMSKNPDRFMVSLCAYAFAAAEENAAGHIVVTAPTCGAAGIIPGVVRLLSRHSKVPLPLLREALLAAVAVGFIAKHNASISGAEVGCQGEVGVASSMAAAFIIGFLIVGNLIGAGILALPINTGLAGFFPSVAGLILTSAAMYYSSVILSREAIERKESTFNYPSLYRHYLGHTGEWIAILANLIILYGLLTAYLTGITSIVGNLFHLSISPVWIMLGFFAVVTVISMAGIAGIQKYIAMLVVVKCVAFVVTAFHFHNIIPAICETLRWDGKTISRTILIGMAMGLAMNCAWLLVGIGVLPLDNSSVGIVHAFQKNLPASVPLAMIMHSSVFLVLAMFFAMIAITTAYLANGMGLIGFMDDIIHHRTGKTNPLLSRVLAFGPPLAIALIYPDLFLKAIDFAGGFGIVTLFGILPAIIALSARRAVRRSGF